MLHVRAPLSAELVPILVAKILVHDLALSKDAVVVRAAGKFIDGGAFGRGSFARWHDNN